MIYEFEGRIPDIDPTAYVSENATVIGKVKIGKEVWIGPGAVLRGDYGEIEVGDYSAIEDNCVIHARPGEKTFIGQHVTIGHLSVIHTGRIRDWAVIGMGSTVSDFAVVGVWAAIGEGAVVKNRQEIPDEAIAVGVPAKVIGKIDEDYKKLWTDYKHNYNTFSSRYKTNLKIMKKP
ncbi:gamma carbonic anhydrase family protein [Thermoplasma sp.]|uniref:gamma carbonic anhydrase family protein n=1 Tax=Thermoplasma sp. TaxID=1973142 RepID=UPI00261E51CB|nr:gamma carbonic anhydrase family protein [Thermoplasma sp.]